MDTQFYMEFWQAVELDRAESSLFVKSLHYIKARGFAIRRQWMYCLSQQKIKRLSNYLLQDIGLTRMSLSYEAV